MRCTIYNVDWIEYSLFWGWVSLLVIEEVQQEVQHKSFDRFLNKGPMVE